MAMVKRRVFFSFDYDNDVMRVSQIKQMGVIEDGETLISQSNWEKIKRNNDAIQKWIDENMQNCSCVIVLIGEKTSRSHWVKYEIEKARREKKGLFGIYIHNLSCPRNGTSLQGQNPFSSEITVYNPPPHIAYNHIEHNIENWIEKAILDSKNR